MMLIAHGDRPRSHRHTKTYDLILWSCKHTGKSPRNLRFVLGLDACRCCQGALKTSQ